MMHPDDARNIPALNGSRNSNQLPSPPRAPRAARERSPARYVTVDEENDGRRIDNFLHSELPEVPRDRLHRLIRRGEVRVNGSRARPGRRLRTGEAVRVPPVDSVRERRKGEGPPPAQIRRIAAAVLYEDDRILVLNKPSGCAVHGGSGVSFGVIELLRAARPASRYLELVHRLDREYVGMPRRREAPQHASGPARSAAPASPRQTVRRAARGNLERKRAPASEAASGARPPVRRRAVGAGLRCGAGLCDRCRSRRGGRRGDARGGPSPYRTNPSDSRALRGARASGGGRREVRRPGAQPAAAVTGTAEAVPARGEHPPRRDRGCRE